MKKKLVFLFFIMLNSTNFADECLRLFYEKKDNKVFYVEIGNRTEIKGVNYKTFEMLDKNGAARDKRNFYYKGKRLKGIDMSTFEISSVQNTSQFSCNSHYVTKVKAENIGHLPVYITEIKDKNGRYSIEEIEAWAAGADHKTFEIINYMYSKDKNVVYYNGYDSGYKLPDSDPKTFEVLSDSYSKDKSTVYHHGKKLNGADSESFVTIGNNYAKDKYTIYYSGKKIEDSDVETFEIINHKFSKDKRAVYLSENIEIKILKELDPDTFEIINNDYSKDKNSVYSIESNGYGIKKIDGADPDTFKIINQEYAKDKNAVYFRKKSMLLDYGDFYETVRMEGIDPSTFKI